MSRRYASRCYAGLGSSRLRTRIPTTRRLGQWVSLRKILRFHVRLQLSQSCCLSLLLAMSGRIFLFFPPRGHEPPPTLRDRLNPDLSLYIVVWFDGIFIVMLQSGCRISSLVRRSGYSASGKGLQSSFPQTQIRLGAESPFLQKQPYFSCHVTYRGYPDAGVH